MSARARQQGPTSRAGGHEVAGRDALPPSATWVRDLHAAYAGPIHVFALRQLGDTGAAEEVVQDTFLAAWRHADRSDESRGSVAGWLFTIARNLVIDRRRRDGARPRVVGRVAEVDDPLDEHTVDRMLESWQVADAVAALTPEHRGAVVAVYYEHRTVAEAAVALEVPEGTVKSRLYYALRALRLRLEEQGAVR